MRRPYPDGRPPSIRDFMAFEEHVVNARRNRPGPPREVPPAWYEIPVFYFTNPGAVFSDGDEIPRPADTEQLDYELELACVIGADGRPEGFTIMNDFSARDLQALEMSVGLGPAKGKDFATALGPVIVSPDELPADLDMRAIARVNGEVRTDSRTGGIHHSWEALLAAAARNTPAGLTAGEVIGSGTVGRGCILEHGDGRWLAPGDEIELEIEGIGVLRNRIV
jgi:fumarylacetoacetate (FAA) hydrolase